MKKQKLIFAVCAATLVLFAGCSNSSDSDDEKPGNNIDPTLPAPEKGVLRINTLAATADNVWIWNDFASEAIAECKDFNEAGGGYRLNKGENGDFVYFDVPLADEPQSVGIIVRKGTAKLSGSSDIIYPFPGKFNEIFLKSGSGTVYIDKDCTKQPTGMSGATITDESKITATTQGITISKDNVKVFEMDGTTELPISTVSGKVITISGSLKEKGMVYVQYEDENGIDKRMTNFDSKLIDSWFAVEDVSSFGCKDGTFTTWAPLASDVQLLLFADANAVKENTPTGEPIQMKRNLNGTWTVKADVGANKYYKYRITHGTETKDVCDIWSKVASYESKASQIAEVGSVEYKNPWSGANYTDAVIYEMHITDWSQAFRPSMQEDAPGTFQEITAALGSGGSGEFAKHLNDLGVTHVQILPMFEYAITTRRTADGKVEDDNSVYNWGYNPYNWNTPESRYAKDMKDGTDAVKAMQDMVTAFHEAGIAVIMDVVYNHTNGTGEGSIYDMTVPGYFYRATDYSGCGNAVNTANEMVKTYVIESLKHWMKDYGINGFRFDLMGIHEAETMKDIYTELSKIDKNVMVYGEPWTGNGKYPTDGCNSAVAVSGATGSNGVGAFDDDFRDAIKGAEFNGFKTGQVQSAHSDSGIVNGLTGKSGNNNRNTTEMSGLALHYVECHDNFTLYDKLVYSLEENLSAVQAADKDGNIATKWPASVSAEQIELIKKQNKLAAAYVILSQGTPFINGGQEFLRTKQGDPDSYAADKKGGVFWSNIDEVNAIDLKRKETYSDVYNTYKGLIKLRKSSPAFTNGTESTARTLSKGITLYTARSGSEAFEVLFNATDSEYALTDAIIEGKLGLGVSDYEVSFGRKGKRVTISEENGEFTVAPEETTVSSVPAKGFVILKK